MTTTPTTPEPTPGIDEALLDEALAEQSPAELEKKILALTDPAMLSLLDEALAPEQADQLTQRILVATQGSMQPGTVPIAPKPAEDVGVIARIGPSTFRYAAAAAIALAVGLGVWFASQDPDQGDNTIADNDAITTPGDTDSNLAADDASEPDWLTDDYLASADLFASSDSAAESLDDTSISRDTIWSEWDAFDAFMSDVEAEALNPAT